MGVIRGAFWEEVGRTYDRGAFHVLCVAGDEAGLALVVGGGGHVDLRGLIRYLSIFCYLESDVAKYECSDGYTLYICTSRAV